MCGKTPKTPKVVERDPVAEQIKAENEGQMAANSEAVARRRRRGGAGAGAGGMAAQAQAMRATQEMIGSRSLLAQSKPKG